MEESQHKTRVVVVENGPLKVEGNFVIKGVDGNMLSAMNKVFLCRCGKSNNKPFCDGSHKR